MIQLVHQLYLFKACIVRDLSSSTLVIPTIVSISMGLLERVLYEEVILGHGYSELGVQLLCQDIAYFFDSLQSLTDEADDADASIVPFCVYEFGVLGEVYRIFKFPQKQELVKMMDDELPFKAIGFLKGGPLQISILGLAQVKTLVMLSMGSNLLF